MNHTIHTRPMCTPGKIAAHMTAKSVIASAERLIEVRHFWCSKYKIAEMSVPACPIPIQKTKFVMSQAHPTGMLFPHVPTPVEIWYPRQKRPKVAALAVMVKATHHQRGAGFSTTPEIRSVNQLKLRLFKTSGTRATEVAASPLIASGAIGDASIVTEHRLVACAADGCVARCCGRKQATCLFAAQTECLCSELISCWFLLDACDSDVCCVRHFGIRIANAGEITRSRIHVQIFEQPVITVLLFNF